MTHPHQTAFSLEARLYSFRAEIEAASKKEAL